MLERSKLKNHSNWLTRECSSVNDDAFGVTAERPSLNVHAA